MSLLEIAEFLPSTAIIETGKLEQFVSEIRVTGFEWLKNISKKSYFSQHFYLCKKTPECILEIIGMLVKRNSKGQTPVSKLLRNNRLYTNKDEIADQLNEHFVNMGPNLAIKIENCEGSPTQFIRSTSAASFVMSYLSY